jgi:hypothetical protein
MPSDPVILTASANVGMRETYRLIVLKAAAGLTVTLPKATGAGTRLLFAVGTTLTSNTYVISRAIAADVMQGIGWVSFGTTNVNGFIPGAADNTITMNGTTCGGYKGDTVELFDTALNLWSVRLFFQATTSAATPYSTV